MFFFSIFCFKLNTLRDENKTKGIDFEKDNEEVLRYFGKSNEK
jgi:hypothetical protein